nr:SAF domain-containing protein [Micromonospora purpureochromogenes]
MAAGLLLVLATVVTFWQVDLRRHADEQFLAVARDVPAGQVITDADVRVARVANPSGLALVSAQRRAEVVGRTAAVPLAEGSLLVSAQVGPAAWPPAGQAVIAVPVKPGRAPAGLAAGSRVVVLVAPPAGQQASQTQNSGARRAVATVVSVAAGADQVGTQLVTVLLPADAAEAVASAAGDVSLVQLGPGQ